MSTLNTRVIPNWSSIAFASRRTCPSLRLRPGGSFRFESWAFPLGECVLERSEATPMLGQSANALLSVE
eukprot:2389799-Amphidinium_carterae.2